MGKNYEKYRSFNTLVPPDEEASPAQVARICHEARMRQLDHIEEELDALRKAGASQMADVLSTMAGIARDGEPGHSTEFGHIPDVILENVEALLNDDNPALRQYALEHYVPLVQQRGPSAEFVELHDATITSIGKDVERLKRKS